jgi:hypothetical protein
MVWALVDPGSFGDFFPNGDHVGWQEGIKRYFDDEMYAEQRAAHDNWDVSYRGKWRASLPKTWGRSSRTNAHRNSG